MSFFIWSFRFEFLLCLFDSLFCLASLQMFLEGLSAIAVGASLTIYSDFHCLLLCFLAGSIFVPSGFCFRSLLGLIAIVSFAAGFDGA